MSSLTPTNKPQDFDVELGNSAQLESEDSVSHHEIAVQETEMVGTNDGGDQKELLSLEETIQRNEIEDEAIVIEAENPITRNDDGFRTPTSSDHKIPSPRLCPPAPRKSRPSKLKRKATSPSAACRRIQFHEPAEVESIFRPLTDQDNVEERKLKKARRKEED